MKDPKETPKETMEDKKTEELLDPSKRKLLKGCVVTLLATASYQAISVLSGRNTAQAGMCDAGCVSACVSSCTSCTTVNCMSGNVPPVPPPTCVQGFRSK